jgi:hypothetical protein
MAAQRIKEGGLVRVDLGDGSVAFGRIVSKSEIAFYDARFPAEDEVVAGEVLRRPIAFIIPVMNAAVKGGRWPVVAQAPLEDHLRKDRSYFIWDRASGSLSTYDARTGATEPATLTEVQGLEAAAVWEAEHVEDRLRDHFAGRPNQWVEQLRPPAK